MPGLPFPASVLFPVRHPHRRVVLSLFTVNLLWLQATFGQRLFSTFGPVAEHRLGFTPAGLALRTSASVPRPEIAVLSQEPASLSLYALSDSGTIARSLTSPLQVSYTGLISADLNRDREPEFISIASNAPAVGVFQRRGGKYTERRFETTSRPQHVAIADINTDGRADLLLFGKGMGGVATLLGDREQGFLPGPVLFPDISVSALQALDVNGDGILDIILCNWLSNQLVLFYGISRMVFSEQVSVDLPGEPDALACTWLVGRRRLGIAATIHADSKVVFLRGTPDGEFTIAQIVSIPGHPVGVTFATVDDDAFPDLVVPADEGTAVARGTERLDFSPPALLGPGASPTGWWVADLDADRRPELIAAEGQSGRLVVLGNGSHRGKTAWPPTYAVGKRPRGVAVEDLDGDGRFDIAVANAGSSSVSFLMNAGKGTFRGQFSLPVPQAPVSITSGESRSAATHVLVSSHPSVETIGVVRWGSDVTAASIFAIPTGPRPHVLYAWQDSSSLRILVRYLPLRSEPVSLSLFEQISGKQFLEHSLQASLPERISAATVGRIGATSYSIAIASHEKSTRQTSLVLAYADRSLTLGPLHQILSFADSASATRGIATASLSRPGSRDFLLFLGKPSNAIGVAYESAPGSYRDTLEWIRNVRADGEDHIVALDVDGDGWPDLTVRNGVTDEIVTFYGGPGGFGPGESVCNALGVDSFAIAPLIDPRRKDLVLTRPADGTISLKFHPFRR
ncbi:MAG: VCBS repeat-containing protein [Bacteroidota bacterium]